MDLISAGLTEGGDYEAQWGWPTTFRVTTILRSRRRERFLLSHSGEADAGRDP